MDLFYASSLDHPSKANTVLIITTLIMVSKYNDDREFHKIQLE